jgi:hypothetical protein
MLRKPITIAEVMKVTERGVRPGLLRHYLQRDAQLVVALLAAPTGLYGAAKPPARASRQSLRTLTKEHLPPGATAYSWQGELYIPGDDGKVRNMEGQEVELPVDFPSDDDLKANRQRAEWCPDNR